MFSRITQIVIVGKVILEDKLLMMLELAKAQEETKNRLFLKRKDFIYDKIEDGFYMHKYFLLVHSWQKNKKSAPIGYALYCIN